MGLAQYKLIFPYIMTNIQGTPDDRGGRVKSRIIFVSFYEILINRVY